MVRSPEAGAAGAEDAPASLPSWEHLVGAPNSLREQAVTGKVLPGSSSGHEDSWGIGWLDAAAQISLLRQTGSAGQSAFFVFASESAARTQAGSGPAQSLIAHLRKASCGVVSSENAHPVRVDYRRDNTDGSVTKDALLIAHNGTLRQPLIDALRSDLRAGNRIEAGSDSDTVILSGWIALQLSVAETESVFDSLAAALKNLFEIADTLSEGDRTRVYTGVNLLIIHASGLYALRQFSRDGEYYTLSARPLPSPDGWVIASEATDSSEAWAALIPGVLYFYSSQGGSGAAQTAPVAVH